MKIAVSQVYIEPGVSFPFSHEMQCFVSERLSNLVLESDDFDRAYGSEYYLVINLSAKRGLHVHEIRGPAVFRRTKDIEFTLFLPYDNLVGPRDGCRRAMRALMEGVIEILRSLKVGTDGVLSAVPRIVAGVCDDPQMFTGPWPAGIPPATLN